MSSNLKSKQSILEEIEKAFRNVNTVCQQYFNSKNTKPIKDTPFPQYKNFNLYKFNKKDNQSENQLLKYNNNQHPDLIDIDQEQNSNLSSFKYPRKQDNQFTNRERQKVFNKPKQNQTKKITQPLSRGNSQTGGKYTLEGKNKEVQSIPSPPKAPLSPYFTFYKEKKDLIKQEFPQMSITQLASAAAKVWKSLTEEEKGPYTKKYFEQKREYEKNMKEYVQKYPNYKQVLKNGKVIKK